MRYLLLALAALSSYAVENRAVASGRNDVVYQAPGPDGYDGMPLGNGQLGVMIRNENGIDALFSHGSFFADAGEERSLVASGEFHLYLPEAWMAGWEEQRLKLYDGEIVLTTRAGTIRCWLPDMLDVLVVEIAAKAPLPALQAELSIWKRGYPLTATVGDHDVSLTSVGLNPHRATCLLLAGDGAVSQVDERRVRLDVPAGQQNVTLLVANPCLIADQVDAAATLALARAAVAKVRETGIEPLRQAREQWWHDFWSTSTVLMTSPDGMADYVENEYNIFLYLMGGQSRGPEPPKFNGGNYRLYQDWRSWGGRYWYQNTRELYWSLLPAGHPEFWDSFVELYLRNLPVLRQAAQDIFGAPGACVHETMGRTGVGDTAGNAFTHLYHTTGTELAFQLYQYYLYTGDEAYLTRIYPLMRDVLRFQLSFFAKHEDGLYHIYPTNSRETWWFVQDGLPDLVAVRCTLPLAIATSEKLGVDAEDRAHWRDVLDHLAPLPMNETKDIFAPAVFLAEFPPVRWPHTDKIYMPLEDKRSMLPDPKPRNSENCICEPPYPWGLIDLSAAEPDLDRMRRTFLARRIRHWGYGNAWDASSLWAARLGLADEVVRCFGQFATGIQMYSAGFCGTPGSRPDIWAKAVGDSVAFDSHGVLAAAAQEIQLQSQHGLIRVYPAWPKGWAGEFTLHAQGGFVVSSSIAADGTVPGVTIVSTRGGTCQVVLPWGDHAVTEIATTPGQTVELHNPDDREPPPPIAVARNDGPRWYNREGSTDTLAGFLGRSAGFGAIGIDRAGNSGPRRAVERRLGNAPPPSGNSTRGIGSAHRVAETGTPPTVDGQLDDACWQTARPFGDLLVAGTGNLATDPTVVRTAWSAAGLHVAARCVNTRIDRMVVLPDTARDDPATFVQEDLELFLRPDPEGPYYQVAITPAGAVYDAVVRGSKNDPVADLKPIVATGRDKDAWTVEITIPWAALGGRPPVGSEYRFNVCRTNSVNGEVCSWARLSEPAYHRPQEFGVLRFVGPGGDYAPVLALDFEDEVSPGKLVGKAALVADAERGGQVLELSGGHVEVPHDPLLTLEDTMTLAAWVRPHNVGQRIIDKCPAGTADGYTFDLHPDNHLRLITPWATVSTRQQLDKDTWHHVAAVIDGEGKTATVYLDGVVVAEAKITPAAYVGNVLPVRLGADSDGHSNFAGRIAAVRIYDRVLNAAELAALAGR